MTIRTPRNAVCPCGSGKKFKLCCIGKDQPPPATATPTAADLQAAKAEAYDCLAQAQLWQQRAAQANERVAQLAALVKG